MGALPNTPCDIPGIYTAQLHITLVDKTVIFTDHAFGEAKVKYNHIFALYGTEEDALCI